MYKKIKKYLKNQIEHCEREREICMDMKPEPLQILAERNYFQKKAYMHISEKITYNSIKRNRFLIDEYKIYYSKINSLYEELEKQGSFKKDKLLRNIKNIYLKAKGDYVNGQADVITIVRKNADNIIDDIQEKLLESLGNSIEEDISFELDVILVDAFIRCKILEKPPKK